MSQHNPPSYSFTTHSQDTLYYINHSSNNTLNPLLYLILAYPENTLVYYQLNMNSPPNPNTYIIHVITITSTHSSNSPYMSNSLINDIILYPLLQSITQPTISPKATYLSSHPPLSIYLLLPSITTTIILLRLLLLFSFMAIKVFLIINIQVKQH